MILDGSDPTALSLGSACTGGVAGPCGIDAALLSPGFCATSIAIFTSSFCALIIPCAVPTAPSSTTAITHPFILKILLIALLL
ncbi:MAG: hypothetical protein WCT20_03165 [Candidatus Babeliales bacterium]